MGEGSRFGELLMWLVFLFGISCFLFFFWFWFILDCFTEAFLKAKFSSTAFVEVSLEEKLLETLGNHFLITQSHSFFFRKFPYLFILVFFLLPFPLFPFGKRGREIVGVKIDSLYLD